MSQSVKMIRHLSFFFLIILGIMGPCKSDTFEDVTLVLTWRSGMQDQKIVRVRSDNDLRNYVGQFGEVLINNQHIPILLENSIINLPKVTHLHLTNSRIKIIKPGAFRHLPELTDFDLSGNLLEVLEDGIFTSLPFRTLYLHNNRIWKIGDTVFNNLRLEYLFLDDNRVSEWKREWFRGTPLTSLSMRNNQLQKLPRVAFEFLWHLNKDPVLESLILSSNGLKSIDFDAFSGVKMILTLDLQNNSLTFLEPGIFDWTQAIDRLQLSNNKITQLYYENFRRTKISYIDVYDNLLECIPTEIFNATQVGSVNVERNPISCNCFRMWEEWNEKNKKPKILGTSYLEEECKIASKATNTPKSLCVLSLLFVLFFYNKTL